MQLLNKKILLTGASSGIGYSLALKLAEKKNEFYLISRSENKLNELAQKINALGSTAFVYPCDVANREAVRETYNKIKSAHGIPDIAILNSGVSYRTSTSRIELDKGEEIFAVNFFGVVRFCQLLVSDFMKRGNGILVGVSSLADVRGFARSGFYSASKSALSRYLESLRVELKPKGIKVITIRPGFVKTPLTDKNEFRMPFIMDAKESAEIILKGLEKEKDVISFPFIMRLITNLLRYMPQTVFEWLSSKSLPRKK